MCEYCDKKNPKYLSERELSKYHEEVYLGIDCGIDFEEGLLMIEACTASGYNEPGYEEKNIKINYCPMCGRKLNTN